MQQMIDEDGNIWPVDANGVWTGAPSLGNVNQQRGMQIKPPDPARRFEAPKAREDLRGSQISNQVDAATAPYAAPTAAANAAAAQANAETARYGNPGAGNRWRRDPNGNLIMGADGQPVAEAIPGVKSPNAPPPQTIANIRSVVDQINHIESLFNQYQKGVGLGSIAEVFPTQGNRAFDTAGAALGDMGTAAFKVPGLGSQSDADAARFVAANQPSRWDSDSQVAEKLGALRRRVDQTLRAMGEAPAQWGAQYDPEATNNDGLPAAYAAQGGGTQGGGPTPPQNGGPTVLPQSAGAMGDQVRVGDESGVTGAGNGLVRDPRLAGTGQELLQMVQAGRPLNEVLAYGDKRFQEVGFPGLFPEQKRVLDYAVRWRAQNPSRPVTDQVKGWENYEMVPDTKSGSGARALGAVATFSPGGYQVGNTATHFLNSAAGGLPAYMAGDQGADVMAASRRTMPLSSAIGDIGGNLAALYGINKLGTALTQTGGRAATLAGQALTRGNGIGGDMLYGATRGGFENGPTGAVMGAAAAGIGNKVGSGIIGGTGRAIRGVSNEAVNRLSQRGIDLNLSALLGNKTWGGKFVTALDSLPFVGANNNARLTNAFEQVNREIGKEAGAPIGFVPNRVGYAGAEDGLNAASNAIENSVAGVNVPIDDIFRQELDAALAAGKALPPDYAERFTTAMTNRINPAIESGNLTGENFSQAMRSLKGYKAEAKKPGFEQDYRDALSSVQDALRGNIARNASPEVVANLDQANTAYRNFRLIEDAVKRARNGSRSGEMEIYTPSQMNDAIAASKYAKSGTQQPFREIVSDAQQVLPTAVPNSGTADRLAAMQTMALPTTIAGAGALAPIAGVDPFVSTPLAGLALALSTKTGAKVAQKALTGRSATARAIGNKILQQRRKAGLFGSTAGLSMLPQFSQ